MLADSRWPGRLVGAWRDERGRPRTFWARPLAENVDADTRYLYLRGAPRSGLPPYGFSEVLLGSPEARRDVVLVEGVFDLHQLRAHGLDGVAALGGTGARSELFERLASLGVETVTLCLDNDEAGRVATARTVEQAARATKSPALFVVDPKHLGSAKDPDAYVLTRGVAAWQAVLEERECAIAWRAGEHLRGVNADSPQKRRREVLSRVGAWLGALPPRLALEQEDAVTAAAVRCGYSPESVRRAFRARFWTEPTCVRSPAQDRDSVSERPETRANGGGARPLSAGIEQQRRDFPVASTPPATVFENGLKGPICSGLSPNSPVSSPARSSSNAWG